jgi:hypothetical protein
MTTKANTKKASTKTAETPTKSTGRPVLVTTEYRGVFFGYAMETRGDVILLKRARNCLYWGKDCRGFLGLANVGPTASCRVGPAADIELRKITCVAQVAPSAVTAWEAAPWA